MTKDRTLSSAIHILTTLAYQEGKLVNSEEIALGMRANPGHVRRILAKLSSAGIVHTEKGKYGGSRLARKASSISLSEIYLATQEGPLFGSFDKEPYRPCPVSCGMNNALCTIYDDIEKDLLKKMKNIKLSKFVEQI